MITVNITTGTDKQINWANNIVAEFNRTLDSLRFRDEFRPLVDKFFAERFFSADSASHYIAMRGKYGHGLLNLIDENRAALADYVKANAK